MNSTETQNQEVNLFNIKNFKTQAKTQLQKRKLIPMISVFITGIFTILFFMGFYRFYELVIEFINLMAETYIKESYDQIYFTFKNDAFKAMMYFAIGYIFLNLISIPLYTIVYFLNLSVHFELYNTTEVLGFKKLFSGYKFFFKAIGAGLKKFFLLTFLTLLFFVPFAFFLLKGVKIYYMENSFNFLSVIFLILAAFFCMLTIEVFFVNIYKYSQMFNIIIDNHKKAKARPVKTSKIITKGYKKDLFLLDMSFVGWFILCILTGGILFLWITPYYLMTKINAYQFLKKVNNLEEEKLALESPSNEE